MTTRPTPRRPQGRVQRIAGLALLGLLPLLSLAAACPDDPTKPAPRDVKVSVITILAAEKGNKVDEEIACIAREVQRVRPELTNFRLAKMTCKSVPVRGMETFELVGDQQADVTVLKGADAQNKVQLKVGPPTLSEITYTTT